LGYNFFVKSEGLNKLYASTTDNLGYMIEKRYSGLKNVKMLVKIFVKVPTFGLKLQPSSGESDKEFVKRHVLILCKSANRS